METNATYVAAMTCPLATIEMCLHSLSGSFIFGLGRCDLVTDLCVFRVNRPSICLAVVLITIEWCVASLDVLFEVVLFVEFVSKIIR